MSVQSDVLSVRDFERLSALVYSECGIRLSAEKRTMLEGRIRKRMRSLELGSCSQYAAYVFSAEGQTAEIQHLINAVTTNKTDFFRESRHFELLTEMALPAVAQCNGSGRERPLLIWSAGCSTGEEPYTLAIVLSEFAELHRGFQFRLIATDISTRVLEYALRAVYPAEVVDTVPAHLRRKYFLRSRDRENPQYRVAPELRELVEFRQVNLVHGDFAMPGPVDVIFCRNVIIYFDRATQVTLMERFARQLRPGGYLFLGHSETLSGVELPFEPVGPTVYRRTNGLATR